MTEQIGITPIAVTKSKHSQKETLKLTMYAEFYLSPSRTRSSLPGYSTAG